MNNNISNIKIKINPLDNSIEQIVLKKLNKNPPESYDKIGTEELDLIFSHIIQNFPQSQTENFSTQIILSIRANMMREHMIQTHKKILSKEKSIVQDYKNKMELKKIVSKYDGSPLNLLRIIFFNMYNKKLTAIIKNKKILSQYDLTQLDWAISHDAYALINQDDILTKSNEFEEKIKFILDKLNVKYKTQNDLYREQIKSNNKPTNTPDFLIQDNLYLNGIKINWIDAKNFYGSKSKFMIKKIKSQTEKYIRTWGTGSIIFNLGFNSTLEIENILMVDFKSFQNISNNE